MGRAWPARRAPQCFGDGRCGLCLPGDTRCREGGLEICDEAGIDFLPSTCPLETPLCIDGACATCPEEVVCAPSLISWGSTKIMVELLAPFSIYPVVYVEPSPPFLGEKGELAADVDGDGATDLIAWRDSTIDVARGLANAFSSPASFFVGATASNGVRARLAGDVDGDGLGDLVEWNSDSVWVLLSTGSAFGSPTMWLQADVGGGPAHLLGDVDGDGRADLVAVTATGASVALSTGSTFTAPAVWSTEPTSGAYGHHLGDFDGDGRADLLTWGTFEKRISLSTGLDFTAPVVWADVEFYGITAVPGSLVHDHDDDGDDDLLALSAVDIYVLPSDGAVLTVPYFQLSGSVYHAVDRGYHVGRSCAKVSRCGGQR
jgi:hypothetical protein